MPRKAFITDLQQAKGDGTIDRISDVKAGDDDGEFTFLFSPAGNSAPVTVSALVIDVSEYPKGHEYHIFAADDTSPIIASAIEDLPATSGKTVSQLLSLVSTALSKCTATGSHDAPYEIDGDGDLHMPDSQATDYDYEGDSDNGGSEEDYWDIGGTAPAIETSNGRPGAVPGNGRGSTAFRQRIRCDLRQAKAAGFKVGHLGPLLDGDHCHLSVSCRIAKLGISEEAMNAWQLEPSQYLILLIAYPSGYKSWDSLQAYDSLQSRRTVQLRVGLSRTYKPTFAEALRAFSNVSDNSEESRSKSDAATSADASMGFRDTFISKPLNDLLNERLLTLIVSRLNTGMLWEGAELYYNDKLSGEATHTSIPSEKYWMEEAHITTLSSLVTADHISETTTSANNMSFPLVAMQFLLRHFVRCTEFCLVCHNKLTTKVEAIKPYVCDRPLCLYQYMSLGFGPSIEHEIIASPYVCDLLVSFCYASAKSGRLKEFPTGLSLSVPPIHPFEEEALPGTLPVDNAPKPKTIQTTHQVRFNRSTLEMIWDDVATNSRCPLKKGDWIVIRTCGSKEEMHCRVSEVAYFPTVKVSEPVNQRIPNNNLFSEPLKSTARGGILPVVTPAVTPCFLPATFAIYDQNFDLLADSAKQVWVCRLLDMLPDFKTMREYLLRNAPTTLSSWVDGISPAALGLLRWIIASNRSCIIQVDEYDTSEAAPGKPKRTEERLFGMPTWKQFRFAMGAPDKEQRFIDSVQAVSARLGLVYPTMFAWHGSPLGNWHGIIREGLHFKQTLHGRAYGDGCYHSLDFNTSQSYSGSLQGLGGFNTVEPWPQSHLNISAAMSLNEIVNAPNEFVSKRPHLVVAQLDWIQTRYLFVRCNPRTKQVLETIQEQPKPLHSYDQDPKMTPQGESGQIIIPAAAVGRSWRGVKGSLKKRKVSASGFNPIVTRDDDAESVASLTEDLNILIDDDFEEDPVGYDQVSERPAREGNSGPMVPLQSTTDFVPGSLDYSKLPLMEEPSYATPAASKRLQKDFKALLKVQNSILLHELGWYIDPELFDNVYQWIVELHSFEAHLPLTKDMKKAGIKSVVLELRFGKDYPMSPPFVRVIRPRFLSFMQGGGGHVTAGGALCMELLTNSGWSAVSSIESVLLQVRLAISSTERKPARLDTRSANSEYGIGEAVEAYIRACRTHGWAVPEGFAEMAMGVPKDRPAVEVLEAFELEGPGRKGKVVAGLKRMFGSS